MAATVSAFLLLFAGVSLLLLWDSNETSQITIDGKTNDWEGIQSNEQKQGNVNNANIDVVSTSILTDSVYLSILTVTDEPMFYSSESYTLRILIDSDDNSETGYTLPGFGADQMVEIYGKNQAILSSILYTFNDNRDSSDWNGFNPLSTVNTRTLGNNIETQVPLFDLGTLATNEMKVIWQTSDNKQTTDLTDNVVSVNGNNFAMSEIINDLVSESNSANEGEGIVIDGYFGDWNEIEKQFNIISSAESEHVDLQNYAAIEQNDESFMYMSVNGNILNGISVPSYSAKSMPDLKTGSTGSNEPVNGVSNQESSPLPVLSSEDTIYVLIDTDNNYNTGYSSIGMDIGAEKMVELKGHYGIITKRVIKEWTGFNQNDWEWTSGELIDAAASGSELELQVVEGDYWIHIIGWNGDEDSSKSFTTINDEGRYIATSDCVFYYNFNSDATDACSTSGGGTLALTGMSTGSGGKMGNGLLPDGSGHAKGALGGIDISSTWSFEAWIKPTTTDEGVIMCICNDNGAKSEDELMIQLYTGDELSVKYDGGGIGKKYASTSPSIGFSSGVWDHIAITHDGSNSIDVYHNGLRIKDDQSFNIDANVGSADIYIGGHPSDPYDSVDFNGAIDDVRFTNYERQAFAGGLMISEVIPGSNTIRVYNAGSSSMTLTGVEVMNGNTICATLSGSLAAATESGTISCTVGTDDGIYLVDSDGDNGGSSDTGFDSDGKEWIIDGVCWNNDGSTVDGECNSSSDPMIEAGVWGINTAVDGSSPGDGGFKLASNGNNDDAVSDWAAIPEFGTLLMPIASVLLIVGYNYRKRNNLEA